jgi:hypothetical protein
VASAALALAGCGSRSTSTSQPASPTPAPAQSAPAAAATTLKFVLHAGLAFGAFHHWIYKPLKSGQLTSGGLLHHKLALVKAGLAGLFAYHELQIAYADAQASPVLSRLLAPLNALGAKLAGLGSALRGGHVDPGAISAANGDVASLSSQAQQAGVTIKDQTPSAAQLSSSG